MAAVTEPYRVVSLDGGGTEVVASLPMERRTAVEYAEILLDAATARSLDRIYYAVPVPRHEGGAAANEGKVA